MSALWGATAAGEGFDAGPAGAAVTTDNTVLSDVFGAGTAVFAAGALDGPFCVRIVTTATQSKYLRRDHTPVPLAWYVWDVYLEGLPTATVYLASWLNGTVKVGDLRVDPAGVLTLRDANRAVIVANAAQALAAAGWYRFAVKVQPGSATGHALRVYAPPNAAAGTTPVVNLDGSAVDAAQTTVSGIRVGVIAAAAITYRIDRLRGDDTTEPGAGTGGGGGGGGTPPVNDLLDEGFEGTAGVPAAGTPVTVTNTTLDAVVGSGSVEFDATAIEGARSALITCTSQDKYLRRDFTPQALGWFTWKLRLPAGTGTGVVSLASWLSGTTKIGDLRLDRATNVLTLRDFNTGVAVATGAPLVGGTDHRIAVKVQPGSATGHQLKVYLSEDSTAPSYNSGGQPCTAAGAATVSTIRLGVVAAGTLTYRLDALRGSSTAEPGISGVGPNADPTADAGPDQRVIGETVVTLGGAGSDTDGTIAGYTWRQISGPTVTLSSLTAASPTFTAPMASADTPLVFGLRVTDDDGALSAEDTVTVTVAASLLYAARSGAWVPKPLYAAKSGAWV